MEAMEVMVMARPCANRLLMCSTREAEHVL